MTTILRRSTRSRAAMSIAGLALAVGSLSACGGDSDSEAGSESSASASASPSDDAGEASADAGAEASEDSGDDAGGSPDESTAEFCGVYSELFETITSSLGQGADVSAVIPQLKEYGERLEEVGPPDDIPEDAERGFEVSIEAINEIPDDATQEDLLAASSEYSAEDQASAQAFGQYVITACPELMESMPSAPTAPSPAS